MSVQASRGRRSKMNNGTISSRSKFSYRNKTRANSRKNKPSYGHNADKWHFQNE